MLYMVVQVRIDHKVGTVHFGALQLESERLHDNISTLARRLAKALTIINPVPTPSMAEFKTKVGRCPPHPSCPNCWAS